MQGEALVMCYDEMGYELWKPYLRSMMEADMKSVSMGTKSKSEVLQSCLQQMKACFLDARVNKVKLLDAMGTFFERSSRPANETENRLEVVRPCGACNESEMVLKRRTTGEFMVGCRGYPQCRNVVWLPGSISEAAVTNQVCPTCTLGPVYKIQFKFRRRDIPPNFDVNHLGCVGGCDDILKELTEISRFGSRNHAATPAREQTPNGVRQGTPRQDLHSGFRPAGLFTNGNPPIMHAQGFRSTHTQDSTNAPDAGQVLCTSCGELCILRTANTEANRGRKFYKCRDPGCGFFKWEDELEAATPRGRRGRGSSRQAPASVSAGRRGRGRNADGGMFVSATGDPVSGCCFTCGDPTHFANACPNRRS